VRALPWGRLPTGIGLDAAFEKLSDSAFRTFVELCSQSQLELTDGVLSRDRVPKFCNSRRLAAALRELADAELITLDGTLILINDPEPWITPASRVEAKRDQWRAKNDKRRHGVMSDDSTPERYTKQSSSARLNALAGDAQSTQSALEAHEDSAQTEQVELFDLGSHPESHPRGHSASDSPLRGRERKKKEKSEEEKTEDAAVQRVVAEACDVAKTLDLTLDAGFKARMGSEARKMIKAGAKIELLVTAARQVVSLNKPPTTLAYILRDIEGGKHGHGRSDGKSAWL